MWLGRCGHTDGPQCFQNDYKNTVGITRPSSETSCLTYNLILVSVLPMNPQCMVLMSSTSLCFIWFTSKKWHILIDLSGSFDFNRRLLAEHQSFYHANWNNRITCIITLEASAAKHGNILSLWHIYCLTAEGKILSCDSTNKPHAWGLFESHGTICAYCICLWLYTLPPDVNPVRPGDEYMRRWIAVNVDSVDGLT